MIDQAMADDVRLTGEAKTVMLVHPKHELALSIVSALADDFSVKIMSACVDAARTVEEVSTVYSIPLSSCYRKTRELELEGLMVIERTVHTQSGKRYALYRSCFRGFRIGWDGTGLDVVAELNDGVLAKLRDLNIPIGYPEYTTSSLRWPDRGR